MSNCTVSDFKYLENDENFVFSFPQNTRRFIYTFFNCNILMCNNYVLNIGKYSEQYRNCSPSDTVIWVSQSPMISADSMIFLYI